MANQNFRVKNGLEVGGVLVVNSTGSVNTSSFPDSGVSAGTVGNTTTIPVVTVDAKGLVTGLTSASVSGVTGFSYNDANNTFDLTTGDGTTYAQTIPAANTTTLGLIGLGSGIEANATGFVTLSDSGVAAATYGNSTAIPVITVDAKGLLTTVSTANVSGVSDFTYAAVNATFTLATGDGSNYAQTIPYSNTTTLGLVITGSGLATNASGYMVVAAGNSQVVSNASGVYIDQTQIDIHSLSGYVANEHIDHSSVSLTAGNGLTGGGDITASRSFAVGAGNGISVAADSVAVDGANGISVTADGVNVLAGNSQLVSNASGVWVVESNLNHDNLSGFVANEHIDHSGVTLTAGNGLTGGGDITASRSFAVVGGTGVTSNSTGVHIGQDVSTTANVVFSNIETVENVIIGGNLTVTGNSVTISTQSLAVKDNMLYMNQGIAANITNIALAGNATHLIFTADNNFANGWDVSVTGVTPSSFNGTYNNIDEANSTHFIVANTNSDTYVSGGTARGKTDSNPDLGWSAGYNDGSYAHAGMFRDATDGVFKVFYGYTPEPDLSVFIDTAHASFKLASFQANAITAASFSGNGASVTSVDAATVGSNTAADLRSYSDTVSGTAYSNAVSYTDTAAGTAYSNAASYADTAAGTAYSNAVSTASSDATTKADSAYTNATSFSANADNITSGTLSGARLLANTGIVANSSGIFTNDSQIVHDNLSGFVANEHIDHSGVSITAGNGLTGGGNITATRTVSVLANTGITANSTGVFTNDSQIVHDNLSGFVANEHIDHSAVSINAGNDLDGGGTIAATRTINVGAGSGISVNSTAVAVNPGNGLTANSTGAHVVAGSGIASNSTGVHVVAGTGVTSNTTGVHIGQAVGTGSSVTFANVVTTAATLTTAKVTTLQDSSSRTLKIYDSSGTLVWG